MVGVSTPCAYSANVTIDERLVESVDEVLKRWLRMMRNGGSGGQGEKKKTKTTVTKLEGLLKKTRA